MSTTSVLLSAGIAVVLVVSEPEAPTGYRLVLSEDGLPLRDDDGNYIIEEI